jgi:hypothetical protein
VHTDLEAAPVALLLPAVDAFPLAANISDKVARCQPALLRIGEKRSEVAGLFITGTIRRRCGQNVIDVTLT